MLRVVVDPNVVVSAAISPTGVTGRLIRLGLSGQFRIVVCPMLVQEANEVLSRPKLRRFVTVVDALDLLANFEGAAESWVDPVVIEAVSRDRDEDARIEHRATGGDLSQLPHELIDITGRAPRTR